MATYTSANISIMYDNSAGTPIEMKGFITEFNGIPINAMIEETHTFGDQWVERTYAGVKDIGEVSFKGFFDDVTNGPDAVFNRVGNSTNGTLTITWGGSKTTSFETTIKSYNRIPGRGQLTKFEVVIVLLSGTVTEA